MTDRPNRLSRRPGSEASLPQGADECSPAQPALDVLSDVLRSVRLTGAVFFLVDAAPPWISQAPAASAFTDAVLPGAQHLISYHVVTQGECWAGLAGAEPQRLEAGDVLLIPHGQPYFLSDRPDARTPECNIEESRSFFSRMVAGALPTVVAVGSGGPAKTHFICGFLGCDRRPFNPILAALPPVIFLRRSTHPDDRMDGLIEFAMCELRAQDFGSRGVLLRLSELMFIATVRQYVASMPEAQEGWLAGLRDLLVGRVLALIHAQPTQPWTLEALAERVATSRSVLTERFTRIVGTPPMHYLTAWRMQLAAGLLADPRSKVSTVALAVGYESEASFSRAFKKHAGMSPNHWRDSCGQKA